jgi:predicted metal-dependent enzyme (double-stranded beta helix superfamily)
MTTGIERLRLFVVDIAELISQTQDEDWILGVGRGLLAGLVGHDDWLPEEYSEPDPTRYRQYLLHCDSQERFSVVAFVWGPGPATPVHNHTVWGLIGVLRGAEISERFDLVEGSLRAGTRNRLEAGDVDAVSPRIGDMHRVSNALTSSVSISIHLYGANIGAVRRATFDDEGRAKPFISGYANTTLPNLWDRSSNVVEASALS